MLNAMIIFRAAMTRTGEMAKLRGSSQFVQKDDQESVGNKELVP